MAFRGNPARNPDRAGDAEGIAVDALGVGAVGVDSKHRMEGCLRNGQAATPSPLLSWRKSDQLPVASRPQHWPNVSTAIPVSAAFSVPRPSAFSRYSPS